MSPKWGGVKFKAHFSPTSVDPPQVIRFIRKHYPDVEFLPLKRSIYDVAVEKTILPSMRIRWCCKEFKEDAGAGRVTLIGVRHAESARRAKRKEVEMSSHKFSGNLDEFEKYRRMKALHPTKRGRKPKIEKPSVANLDAIDSEHISGCISGKDSLLISPIIDWTEDDVWYFLNEVVHVPHCELYDQGYHRIGCIMCPMSSHKQKLREMKDFPYVKAKWIEAIKKIRMGGVLQSKSTCRTCNSGGKIRNEIQQNAIPRSRTMEDGLPTRTRTLGFSYIKQTADAWTGGQKRRANYGVWDCQGFQMAPRLTA